MFTAQSGTPGGPVITNLSALGTPYAGQYGPATMTISGRTVNNPFATTNRFAYKDRGTGQIWCPWLLQWNVLAGREFRITDRQSVEATVNIYNLANNGGAQQFVNGNNIASATFGELQNVQQPRSAQFGLRYRF